MPNTVLGKVACTPKGDYSEGAAYVVLDIVAYGGGSYMALKDVTGVTPNNDGVNWMQLAAPGNTGDTGEQGDPGAAAGFGTVSATVDETTGTPSVKVETSGPDTAKNFAFSFSGLKGETGGKGDTGNTGPQGEPGAAAGFGQPTATVDNNVGTPGVTVETSGPDTAKVFAFKFVNLKGNQGEQGIQGVQGPAGTSVSRIDRTSGNGAPGTTDTYTMYDSEDVPIGTFTVYNGMDGIGSGDMLKSTYDPQNKNTDIFDYVDKAVEDVTVTTDPTPTQDSENPVQSGGVYDAIQSVEDGIPTKVSELTNDSGYLTTESDPTVPGWAKSPSKPTYTAAEVGARSDTWMPSAEDVGAIPASQKGAASGVAELDSSGKVPSAQLPSYVDDVVEFASRDSFPGTGEDGKIYIAEDTNLTYRWSGTQYVEISPSLALGETSSTAYRGDRGKIAYDHSQTTGNPHNTTAADVGAMPAVSGGSTGQVLTKTENGQAWQDAPETGMSQDDADARYLQLSGGTMTGDITLKDKGFIENAKGTLGFDGVMIGQNNPSSGGSGYARLEVQYGRIIFLPQSDEASKYVALSLNGFNLNGIDILNCPTIDALKSKTATVTLTAAGWTQSGERYSQSVSCSIVKTDSPIVLIDAALSGTDLDADAEVLNAWAGPSAQKTEQGDGTLTFYSVEAPTVNIPVSVGVIG